MPPNEFVLFRDALNSLVGQACWSVQAGHVGSLALLQFGLRLPMDTLLPFPDAALSIDEHRYRGEFMLYVEDCPWRIESSDEVLATWLDSNAPSGPIVTYMKSRIGKAVTAADVNYPGMDLVLSFDDEVTLRIFPDQVDADSGENYALRYGDDTFVVTAKSHLYVE